MHGLRKRSIACGVPQGEAYPLLTSRLKRHAKFVAPKWAHASQTDDLAINGLSIAPYQFREFGRERPLRFRCVRAIRAITLDAPITEQHFSASDEIVSGA